MITAANGNVHEVAELTETVLADQRSTYLDRITALLALALSDAGAAGDGAISRARIEVGATEDLVAAALVSLAGTIRSNALGVETESERLDAEQRLADLGMSGTRWRSLYTQIAAQLSPQNR